MAQASPKRAKELRRNSTEVEKLLWKCLRKKQVNGFKFRRQQPIGPFIVDFFSSEGRIVVELDGGQHALELDRQKDLERDRFLQNQGYRVLRFWNNEIIESLDGVVEIIRQALVHSLSSEGNQELPDGQKRMSPSPVPSLGGEGK